jgi:hypothetical protein
MNENHQQRLSGTQRMSTAKHEVRQGLRALTEDESLSEYLMEKICKSTNLNRAYKRVKANKGNNHNPKMKTRCLLAIGTLGLCGKIS